MDPFALSPFIEACASPLAVLARDGGVVVANQRHAAILKLLPALHDEISLHCPRVSDSGRAVTGSCHGQGYRLQAWSHGPSPYVVCTLLEQGDAVHAGFDPRGQIDGEAQSDELRRVSEDLQAFTYLASHDLQEPVRTINSFGNLILRRAEALDDDCRSFLGYMIEGGQRMERLLAELLTFSRVATHRLRVTSVDCDQVLEDVLETLSDELRSAGAEVQRQPLPPAMGEADWLHELFVRLIGNALKFRSQLPPQLRIEGRRDGAFCCYAISDNGIGIAPQFHDRIFLAGKRLNARETHPGTGMGLAIARRIVVGYGGSIDVDSAPGAGSTFTFTLPAPPSGYEDTSG